MIEIDGSLGEGGGQVLRGAVALACITGESVRVLNIRGRRPNPGLQPQHLLSMQAAAKVTDAKVEGLSVGSSEVSFAPGGIRGGNYSFDIKTAGSVTMVLQTLLPILIFAGEKSEVEVTGGTDVPWSPPVDYMKHVALPVLQSMGVVASMVVLRRGHYPKGGGQIRLGVTPVRSVAPIRSVERGPVEAIRGVSHCTNLPAHVAARQAASAERMLKEHGNRNLRISTEGAQTPGGGPGSGITLWAEVGGGIRIGADSLGERDKKAEVVGSEAAERLLRELEIGMAIDSHLGDMIIPYMAVANGTSEAGLVSLTQHSRTMMWICSEFLKAEWQALRAKNGGTVVRVAGAGITNRHL